MGQMGLMRLLTLLFCLGLISCAPATYKPTCLSEGRAFVTSAVSRGILSKDEGLATEARWAAQHLPAEGNTDAVKIERAVSSQEKRLGQICEINRAYNTGAITEGQRVMMVTNYKTAMAQEKAAKDAAIAGSLFALSGSLNSAAASMNQSTAIINQNTASMLSAPTYQPLSTTRYYSPPSSNIYHSTVTPYIPPATRTINLYPTYGGGYRGTIR